MKIMISSVDKIDGESFVRFQSGSGQGSGRWMGGEDPVVNCSYDVELDTDKKISEVLMDTLHQPEHALTIEGDNVLVFGVIDSIEDDGMIYLRLSPDCLVMIEAGDAKFSEGEQVVLKIECSNLEITAQGK